jgi:hypothetical protein
MTMSDWLDIVKFVADVAVVPAIAMIYSIQGRISKIEGQFQIIVQLLENSRSTNRRS